MLLRYKLFLFVFLFFFVFVPVKNSYSAEDWDFKFAPYFWMSSINGDITVKGMESEANVSFSDIWDVLNFGLLFEFEGIYKEKYGFFISPVYMNLKDERDGLLLEFDTEVDTLIVEGGFIYNLLNTDSGNPNQNTKVDFLLGGRLWYLESELDIEGPMGGKVEIEGDETWFDFFTGIRLLYEYKKFDFSARTDIGGFNLGFSSDISWNISAIIGYEVFNNFIPFIGYRALYADYDDGSGDNKTAYDAWTYGPLIGFAFEF